MRSMTGYGKADYNDDKVKINVEIRSLNNRNLDLQVNLPVELRQLEPALHKLIRSSIERGRIDCWIYVRRFDKAVKNIYIDKELAEVFANLLREIGTGLKINDDLKFEHFIRMPDLIQLENGCEDIPEWLTDRLNEVLLNAIEKLEAMQIREGEDLKKAISNRITAICDLLERIKQSQQKTSEELSGKLHEKIKTMLKDINIDESRFAQEAAFIAEKSDITEEIDRLDNHIRELKSTIEKTDTIGKKLDFLLQEMTREINTLNAKTRGIQVNNLGVEIKLEIEKIREQSQNIV